jgi:uncharacterized hydantoinase/oxoprolinase family protein
MAKYIYDKQVLQVAEGLNKVYSKTKTLKSNEVSVAVTGLGKDFIARKAAEKIGVHAIVDLGTLLNSDVVVVTPAFAVALMTANKLEGEIVKWTWQ